MSRAYKQRKKKYNADTRKALADAQGVESKYVTRDHNKVSRIRRDKKKLLKKMS